MMEGWFNKLSSRDRRIVLVALPVIVVLLVLVALRSLPAGSGDPQQRLTRALEDIAWLDAQHSRIAPVRCTVGEPVAAIAHRHNVPVTLAPENDGTQRLAIHNVAGNAVVALARELECAGYGLRHIDWATVDDKGTVRGSLTLDPL